MARIKLTVRKVAERNGIHNPFVLAKETGLNYSICHRLWNENQQRVDLKTLERLCEVLSAKPGQFFEYDPDAI